MEYVCDVVELSGAEKRNGYTHRASLYATDGKGRYFRGSQLGTSAAGARANLAGIVRRGAFGVQAGFAVLGIVVITENQAETNGIMQIADAGGSFDWLHDEPDYFEEAAEMQHERAQTGIL